MEDFTAADHSVYQVRNKDTLPIMLGFCNSYICIYIGNPHDSTDSVDHPDVEEFQGKYWFKICGRRGGCIFRSCCGCHSRCGSLGGSGHNGGDANRTQRGKYGVVRASLVGTGRDSKVFGGGSPP